MGLLYGGMQVQGQDPAKMGRLHRLQAGESLNDVAERLLGGSEFTPELLELNNIRNPMQVREGTWIALPGPIRDEAIQSFKWAEAALKIARDAQAEVYAKQTFLLASEKIEQAGSFRFHANYEKSVAHSKLGAILANQARQEADANARVSRDARISLVHGQVEISEDGGSTWQIASAGAPLPIAAILKTVADSRAEVRLQDGSIIQVRESSEFQVDQFIEDRRNGKVDARLNIRIGSMLGKIKPKTSGSKMSITSGMAAIAIRGTVLRVRTDQNKTTYSEVLEGGVEVIAGRKRPVSVMEHFGVIAKAGQSPSRPTPLLAAPQVMDSPASQATTAVQRVQLAWHPLRSRELETYQVEIAQDAEFYTVEQNLFTRNSEIRSEILLEGDYFWRVTAIDKHGLVGLPGKPQRLFIRKDLRSEIWFRGKLIEHRAGFVAGPVNEYLVRPATLDTSIVRYEYSINAGEFQELATPVRIKKDGAYDLRMRGIGAEGDVGSEQSLSFRVDATPPRVSLNISAPFLVADGTHAVEASLDASDETGLNSIQVSVDRKPFVTYQGPFALSAYKNYTVRFRTVDLLGNRSPEFEIGISGEWVPRSDLSSYAPIPKS